VNFRKYMVLVAVMFFGACGDTLLARGMRGFPISLSNWTLLFHALVNPWVIAGMVCLIIFFASYLSALSWADLTFVLPATAIGYVLLALFAKFLLHENVTLTRWIGILLITAGVGFVTRGPELTPARVQCEMPPQAAATEVGQ
jgi:drug/metabolite transporter (DMT)-like permease